MQATCHRAFAESRQDSSNSSTPTLPSSAEATSANIPRVATKAIAAKETLDMVMDDFFDEEDADMDIDMGNGQDALPNPDGMPSLPATVRASKGMTIDPSLLGD